ncbi:MAG: hypothetical protein N3G76_00945, partial [Candidatus Micrarchaeota archaeon]|nr:hypothetical protein [Candidatus Micrarchaeota archaeon]
MRKRLFLVLAALVLCALLAGCIQQAPGAESDRGNITESPAQNTTLLPEENINAAHNNTAQENKSLNAMAGFTIKNERTGKSYSGRYIINESGMYIYFDDPLPKFSGAI